MYVVNYDFISYIYVNLIDKACYKSYLYFFFYSREVWSKIKILGKNKPKKNKKICLSNWNK